MKTVTVEELHTQTEQVLNEAASRAIVVTKDGRPQVILNPYPDEATRERHWEKRERMLAQLPELSADSTKLISEDREGR